jgi:hypothetical protein
LKERLINISKLKLADFNGCAMLSTGKRPQSEKARIGTQRRIMFAHCFMAKDTADFASIDQGAGKRRREGEMTLTAKALLGFLIVALIVIVWMFRLDVSQAGTLTAFVTDRWFGTVYWCSEKGDCHRIWPSP